MLRIFTIIYLEEICAGGDLRWFPIEFVHSTSELTIFYGTDQVLFCPSLESGNLH